MGEGYCSSCLLGDISYLPLNVWHQLLHQLNWGIYIAFPLCVLASESRIWFPSAVSWTKLKYIAFIFKTSFLSCFLLPVSTSVKQQYHDNIRWIREAGKHSLVSARPPLASVSAPGTVQCFSVSEWIAGMGVSENTGCNSQGWKHKHLSTAGF